jgi:hypothetical protein
MIFRARAASSGCWTQVGLFLLGEGGNANAHAGQVDALVVGDLAADHDRGADPVAGNADDV